MPSLFWDFYKVFFINMSHDFNNLFLSLEFLRRCYSTMDGAKSFSTISVNRDANICWYSLYKSVTVTVCFVSCRHWSSYNHMSYGYKCLDNRSILGKSNSYGQCWHDDWYNLFAILGFDFYCKYASPSNVYGDWRWSKFEYMHVYGYRWYVIFI